MEILDPIYRLKFLGGCASTLSPPPPPPLVSLFCLSLRRVYLEVISLRVYTLSRNMNSSFVIIFQINTGTHETLNPERNIQNF